MEARYRFYQILADMYLITVHLFHSIHCSLWEIPGARMGTMAVLAICSSDGRRVQHYRCGSQRFGAFRLGRLWHASVSVSLYSTVSKH